MYTLFSQAMGKLNYILVNCFGLTDIGTNLGLSYWFNTELVQAECIFFFYTRGKKTCQLGPLSDKGTYYSILISMVLVVFQSKEIGKLFLLDTENSNVFK